MATLQQDGLLGDLEHGFVSVADTAWNGVNLAVVDWTPLLSKHAMLGDEQTSRAGGLGAGWNVSRYEPAARANRQLAVALQAQGLDEAAAHFAYRTKRLQRMVLAEQGKLVSALGSWLLDVVAGYGYKPLNGLIVYLALQVLFTGAYLILGHLLTQQSVDLRSIAEAVILSVTSFHGRAFLPQAAIPGSYPLAYGLVAAFEAIIGLFIEAVFVATLIQRFFR